jgi:hypothetical protein
VRAPLTTITTPPVDLDALSIAAFEAGNISAHEFSHEAHIFIGWSYLQETDLQQAIRRFTAAIRRLTRKLGAEGKYHETVTWFFMMVIAERCRSQSSRDWTTFKTGNPDLFADAKELLSRYYTKTCLDSELARKQFVLPDRLSQAQGAAMT